MPYEAETRVIGDRTFRIEWEYDNDMGPPQKESDGHGVVDSLDFRPEGYLEHWDYDMNGEPDMEDVVRNRMRRPMQRYVSSRHSRMYYDVWETLKTAKRDGWRSLKWELEHPDSTEDEKVMAAVDADYEYLRGWYEDDWHWCIITVTEVITDDDGEETDGKSESLCGIGSDDDEYHEEVINELVGQIPAEAKLS